MKNFSVIAGDKVFWVARNMAVVTFVFAPINGEWCVLANMRGKGTPDFQGMWNCPCGYLDYDETTKQAAIREVFEETGVILNHAKFWSFDDNPASNLQNVTFRYYSIITNPQPNTISVSTEGRGGEKDEVGAISWIPLSKVDEFQWAFQHSHLIKALVKELELV